MPPYPTLPLAFHDHSETEFQCSTLFVATYGAAALFAYSLVGSTPPSNRINFSKQKQQSLADLYQVGSSVFLIFNDHPDAMREFHLAKFIEKHIRTEKVVVLVSLSKTTLKEHTGSPLAVPKHSFSTSQRAPFPKN
jgi:hypothetical protein